MNQYPLWKYLLIIIVLAVGTVYALPNIYPSQPAVQISPAIATDLLSPTLAAEVKDILDAKEIVYRSIVAKDNKMIVRFGDLDQQRKAKDLIEDEVGKNYAVALNLVPNTPIWLRNLNALPMYLGLDLRGGVHFLMEVDMDEAVKKNEKQYASDIADLLRPKDKVERDKLRYLTILQEAGNEDRSSSIVIKFRTIARRDYAQDIIGSKFKELLLTGEDRDGAFFIRGTLSEDKVREIKKYAMTQNLSTLRKRVNEIGVAEPIIQQQGEARIVVQLPGVQDPEEAIDVLGATATLEYHAVDQSQSIEEVKTGRVAAGSKLYKDRDGNPVLLKKATIITGSMITYAAAGLDTRSGSPMVSVRLNDRGADRMLKFTKANVGKPMAVVYLETKSQKVNIDGKEIRRRVKVEEVISVANILGPFGPQFQTTGLDDTNEASRLALLLRAGSLAAPMYVAEERTIGPSLGQDSIDQGALSVAVGFALVLIFMILWYRGFGMIANIALALNLVLIVAVLSLLQATLTLPGIAGIVLTVGMAVDANVLIFERIREEIRIGNSPQASIAAGYDKAFLTIADANITTLIAAVVLFAFGSGPVAGFAVTLMIGIVMSMFTAIVGTRAVVNLLWGRRRLSTLSI